MKTLIVFLIFLTVLVRLAAQDNTNFLDKYKISNVTEWSEKRMSYYLNTENRFSNELESYYNKGFENVRLKNYDSAIVDFKKSIGVNEPNSNNDWQSIPTQKNYHPYFFIGICKKSISENDSAIIYFQKSLEVDPNFEHTYIELGILNAIDNNTKMGLYYCDELLKLNKNSVAAYYLKAQIYYYNLKYQPALKALRKAIKIEYNFTFAHLLTGDIFYKKQYAETAIKSYTRVTEMDPELTLGYIKLGLAYIMDKKYKLAILNLEKSITLDSTISFVSYLIGYVNIIDGNYKEGTRWMSKYIENKRENKATYYSSTFSDLEIDDIILTLNNKKLSGKERQVGYILLDFHFNYKSSSDYGPISRLAKRDTSSAFGSRLYNYLLFIKKGHSITPERTNKLISNDSSLLYIMLLNAELNNLKGDSDKSIELLNFVIEKEPSYTDAYNKRGEIYLDKGELNNSLMDFEYALSLNKDFLIAQFNRGKCYYEMELYSQCLNDYIIVKNNIGENPYLYNSIASCYGKVNEKDSALMYFTKSIKINPEQHEAYYHRGKMYFDAKMYDKALSDFNTSIFRSSNIQKYYYQRALTRIKLHKNEYAVIDLKHLISLNPNFPGAYYQLGRIYYKAGKYTKCIKYSTLATKQFPESYNAFYNIAISILRLGNFEESLQLYRETAKREIKQTQYISKKAVDDLKFLIDNNLNKNEAKKILNVLLNIKKG